MRALAALTACAFLLGGASSLSAQTLTPTSPPPAVSNPPPAASNPPPVVSNPPPVVSNPQPAAPSSPTITTLTSFSVGNWSAGAYSVAGGTTLDHCAGAATYNSGITIAFAVSSNFQWSMGLFDPNWNLAMGTTYPVAFTIDGSSPDFATATAIGANEVDIPLAPTVALFKKFMEGEMLKVEAATQVFSFKLTNTSELLPDLLKCVEAYAGVAPPSSNPFVKG